MYEPGIQAVFCNRQLPKNCMKLDLSLKLLTGLSISGFLTSGGK